MALTDGYRIDEGERNLQPIYPTSASAFVLLAQQGNSLKTAHEKLKSALDKGYEIRGHRFRPDRDIPSGRSEELDRFFNILENVGYAFSVYGTNQRRIHLNQAGIELLERKVLQCFIEDAELTENFARDTGLKLQPIFQKYLEKFLDLSQTT